MASQLLVKGNLTGREIVNVTPERAGWNYVGFRAVRLADGESEIVRTDKRELCIVVLTGSVDIVIGDKSFTNMGGRNSVFEPTSPTALYVPAGKVVHIRAVRAAEIALCTAPSDSVTREVAVLDPAKMRRTVRGKGLNTRYICDILPHDNPVAAHLLVVEVVTPAGHSSSYPPHKHDQDIPQIETQLEETYYHRLNPPQGFAFQRVYTDDRSLDEACAVENHDVVLVPRGYHPVVAPYGYDLYYLNVMAGPKRLWIFKNDTAHEWILK